MRKNTHPQFGYADTQALYNTPGLDRDTQEVLYMLIGASGALIPSMDAYARGDCTVLDNRIRDVHSGMLAVIPALEKDPGARITYVTPEMFVRARNVITDYIERK